MDKLKAHTDKPDTSRAAFEAWGHSQNQSGNTDRLQRKGDGYVFTTADIMWQAWQAGRADQIAKLDSEKVAEVAADSMMEHLPSSMVFNPNDPSGYKWAKAIAVNCSMAAITAIKQQLEGGE